MDFRAKMMPGETSYSEEEYKVIQELISAATEAEEMFETEELEEYATGLLLRLVAKQKNKNGKM